MKIYYASDPHVNNHVPWRQNQIKLDKNVRDWTREVFSKPDSKTSTLVVAGDFSEWNCMSYSMLDELGKMYKYVLGVIGNHDRYILSKKHLKKFSWSSDNRVSELKELLKSNPNVFLMDNEVLEFDGIKFGGTSLWYKLERDEDKAFYKSFSHDSSEIYELGKTLPDFYHDRDMKFYKSMEEVDVLITHVPPMKVPISKYPFNSCYITNVTELKAKHWICGHEHNVYSWRFFDTNFYMNCIGNNNYKDFELKSFIVEP